MVERIKHILSEIWYHLTWIFDVKSWWPDIRSGDGTAPFSKYWRWIMFPFILPLPFLILEIIIVGTIVYYLWN